MDGFVDMLTKLREALEKATSDRGEKPPVGLLLPINPPKLELEPFDKNLTTLLEKNKLWEQLSNAGYVPVDFISGYSIAPFPLKNGGVIVSSWEEGAALSGMVVGTPQNSNGGLDYDLREFRIKMRERFEAMQQFVLDSQTSLLPSSSLSLGGGGGKVNQSGRASDNQEDGTSHYLYYKANNAANWKKQEQENIVLGMLEYVPEMKVDFDVGRGFFKFQDDDYERSTAQYSKLVRLHIHPDAGRDVPAEKQGTKADVRKGIKKALLHSFVSKLRAGTDLQGFYFLGPDAMKAEPQKSQQDELLEDLVRYGFKVARVGEVFFVNIASLQPQKAEVGKSSSLPTAVAPTAAKSRRG